MNQTELFENLKKLTEKRNQESFIFEFLALYNLPKSTITRLKKTLSGDQDNINIATNPEVGEIAYQRGVYFKPIKSEESLLAEMDKLRALPVIKAKNIHFIIVTNYVDLLAYDVVNDESLDLPFEELYKEYGFFLPLAGLEKGFEFSDNPADVKAAERIGRLFDLIRYRNEIVSTEETHALNVFLTRLLFCFFAESTEIFKKGQFTRTVAEYTKADGSDLKAFLKSLFKVLNSPEDSQFRQNAPRHLTDFPYVNGQLFEKEETIPHFDARTRRMLLDCSNLDWSEINPDIFGSMFQAVINKEQRRRLGQHYTSVPNILKVLCPLFLEPLEKEFERSRHSEQRLKSLLVRLGNIHVFDPACGSGNFLIIAFKELRALEIKILKAIRELDSAQQMFVTNIGLDQFHGIEIDDFAHEIARLSLWLAEHQMNRKFNQELSSHLATLPLHESGHVVQGNSLRMDWEQFCPTGDSREIYVVGNPPFNGVNSRSDEQSEDMEIIFKGFKGFNSFKSLDYVTSWFWRGAQYIKATDAKLALVATNSICQGAQVAPLWEPIFELGVEIDFAYQAFPWKNSARDVAGVHVVIIGLSRVADNKHKKIYREIDKNWHQTEVKNINPYLIEGKNLAIVTKRKPICSGITPMTKGSIPYDAGNLLLTDEEKEKLLEFEPEAEKWIKPILGAHEFINNISRWCLWLKGISSEELKKLPEISKKIERVRDFRLSSTRKNTREWADIPHLFGEDRQPRSGHYILVPSVSSERRRYIPVGFYEHTVISSNRNYIIPNGTLYDFGVLNSTMHNDWVRIVSGRLEMRFSYSVTVVYNTFPWPQNIGPQRRAHIEELAKDILRVRARYPDKTLADLYDPEKMPRDLLAAHEALDRAVEKLYRDAPFRDSSERLEHLFKQYEKLIAEEEK